MQRTYNNQKNIIDRVYYSGTDTLAKGSALCFKHDATTTDTDPRLRLGTNVVKPATANLFAFAGILDDSSIGAVGPCFVNIVRPQPGVFVEASVKANATLGVTKLGPANNSYDLAAAAGDITTAVTEDAALAKQVAIATATADTSGGAAIKTVKYL